MKIVSRATSFADSGHVIQCADDVFNGEAKKVTAVYKRRPKNSHEPPLPDRTSSGSGTTGGRSDGIFVFRDEGYVNFMSCWQSALVNPADIV
jgi:hypothetical protein